MSASRLFLPDQAPPLLPKASEVILNETRRCKTVWREMIQNFKNIFKLEDTQTSLEHLENPIGKTMKSGRGTHQPGEKQNPGEETSSPEQCSEALWK